MKIGTYGLLHAAMLAAPSETTVGGTYGAGFESGTKGDITAFLRHAAAMTTAAGRTTKTDKAKK